MAPHNPEATPAKTFLAIGGGSHGGGEGVAVDVPPGQPPPLTSLQPSSLSAGCVPALGVWRAAGARREREVQEAGGRQAGEPREAGTMVLSVPVIALGATLGTATSILALCGVTCLCRHMHPKKGLLPRDGEPDPEKARPGVLRPTQQVSAGGPGGVAGLLYALPDREGDSRPASRGRGGPQ